MAGYIPMPPDYFTPAAPPVSEYAPKAYPDTLISQTDVQPLLNLLATLPHGAAIACDTETTGLFPYEDDVIRGVSIAFTTPNPADFDQNGQPEYWYEPDIHSFYIPVNYPEQYDNLSTASQRLIFQAIKDLDPFLIFHHMKFDIAFLRQLPMTKDGGVYFPFPRPTECWDTKVVAWLLDENMPTGLKEQAAFHFGEDSKDEQKIIKKLVREKGWDGLTPADTYLYAAMDAELTLRLYARQLDLIAHPSTLGNIRPAVERELAVQGVLARMEALGILVNPTLLQAMTESTAKRIAEIESTFSVNLKSPMQLKKYLAEIGFEVTSTARDKLEALDADSHPALALILEHRRLQKALSGYLTPLKERMGRDGRIHAGFSSTGTVTGRYSCSKPNLQTIPRSDTLTGVRDIFIAEPGMELWEFDLAAAEMRVMAGMAGQENMIEALETPGADVHGDLAAQVFGDKYTSLQRRYAKNVGYGWNYGLTSVKTAAKYIKGDNGEAIAQKILAGLKKRYPEIVRLMNRTTRQAEKDGFIPIHDDENVWPGRYRRFRTPSARRSPAYTGLNAKVQGGIAEFLKDVMIVGEPLVDAAGARICLQVHDSLICEVPEGLGPKVQEILQQVADDVNPFTLRMVFEGAEWSSHE